jgi:ABC-type amino acid transport substrate-binding protein
MTSRMTLRSKIGPSTSAAVTLAVLLLIAAAVVPSRGQTSPPASPGKLVVGTMRIPPFVFRGDDGQWSGLSIDLWKQIAADLKRDYEFREFDYDQAGLLDAVESGRVDVAVAAIPVTAEGEARLDFSHPYFAAGLGIAVRTEPQSGVRAVLGSFLTYRVLGAVAGLLGVMLLMGILIWLLERRHKSGQFDPRPVQGVGDGVWWAAVTMTSTGYGDKVPVSAFGRSLAVVWMFVGIFLTGLFSATLASSFVVDRLQSGVTGPGDLVRARVAAVPGTVGEQWLGAQGLPVRAYPFVIQASKALQRGDVEALVYERPILGHMIKENNWSDLRVLPHTLAVSEYAIAVPAGSALKEPINRALLKVIHRPDWKTLVQRYVGSVDSGGSGDKP